MSKVLHFSIWLLRNELEHCIARLALFRRPHVQSAASPMLAWTWRRCAACHHVSPFPADAVQVNPFCCECGSVMRQIGVHDTMAWDIIFGTFVVGTSVAIAWIASRAR